MSGGRETVLPYDLAKTKTNYSPAPWRISRLLATGYRGHHQCRDELVNGLQAQRTNRLRDCEMFTDLEESDFLQMRRSFVEVSITE